MSRIQTPAIESATGLTAEVSLAVAVTTFTNIFNRINDTTVDFPSAS